MIGINPFCFIVILTHFRKKISEFDPSRTAKFFILGSCVVAPVIRTWYLALERIVKFPGKNNPGIVPL